MHYRQPPCFLDNMEFHAHYPVRKCRDPPIITAAKESVEARQNRNQYQHERGRPKVGRPPETSKGETGPRAFNVTLHLYTLIFPRSNK